MTLEAEAAREMAAHFEAKKTGFGQAQDGWSLTLRIQDGEVPPAVRDAKKGTRYMVALVELNDDETPKDTAPASSVVRAAGRGAADGGRNTQRQPQHPYVKRAWQLCADTLFQLYTSPIEPEDYIRRACLIPSRSHLAHSESARTLFDDMESEYGLWLTDRRVGQ